MCITMDEHYKLTPIALPDDFDEGKLNYRLNTARDFEEKYPLFPPQVYPILERQQKLKDEAALMKKPVLRRCERREGKFVVKF